MSSKILIVEDDPVSGRMLEQLLGSSGHNVKWAKSGFDAWMILTGFNDLFDVVFLDLGLPDLNGLELLERVRKAPRLRSLKIIVCTAANDRDTVLKAMERGIRFYIVKPFAPKIVLAKLAEATAAPPRSIPAD